jgi:hypothetical protein
MCTSIKSIFGMLLCSLLFACGTLGQRLDGGLRVTVTDKSGGTIQDARVTVINEGTNVTVTASESSAGTYVFPNLLVGSYSVTVEKDGFKKGVSTHIQVESNQMAESAATLEVGDASLVVEVEAGAELVKTESSTLDATFEGKSVQDIPINTLGGDVKELAVFAPGTTTQQGGVLGSGGSIGGTRPRFNGFNIDGVEDNKLDTNGPTQPVIQEAVAEFTLLTNQFSAEYGHSAGGIFNTVTKSGTNARLQSFAAIAAVSGHQCRGWTQSDSFRRMDTVQSTHRQHPRILFAFFGAGTDGSHRL